MLWQVISCFVKHHCVYRPTKRNNKKNSDKNTSFENPYTIILKTQRRVNIKLQNSTITAITVMTVITVTI